MGKEQTKQSVLKYLVVWSINHFVREISYNIFSDFLLKRQQTEFQLRTWQCE